MAKFSNAQCKQLAIDILAEKTVQGRIDILDRAISSLPSDAPGWKNAFLKLRAWLTSVRAVGYGNARTAYKIFAKGNGKLPFWSFSTLPGTTCPGAGACLAFCYSFTGWRFPSAFCRQLQNTILIMEKDGRDRIAFEFASLRIGAIVRLYVDGDFDSLRTVEFWFALLETREDVRSYGYSKSWVELLAYANTGKQFPSNYVLNLSSGSLHGDDMRERMARLPITRGEFRAVAIDTEGLPNGVKRYENREYHNRVRQASIEQTGQRVFSCPGKCGLNCRVKAGMHACGDKNFVVPIAIGIH